MRTTRIDQYICLDVDRIIVDEMEEILSHDSGSNNPEDIADWKTLQMAAQVILENYKI